MSKKLRAQKQNKKKIGKFGLEIKSMELKKYISIYFIFCSLLLFSQEAELSVSVSKNKLGLNQRLRVEFSINKQGADNFTPPKFSNFKVIQGPSQSVSQS